MPAILESPAEIDYSQYLSVESKGRVRSQLKALRPYFDRPNMISVSPLQYFTGEADDSLAVDTLIPRHGL